MAYGSFDVIVVGGGLAGISAALSARESGASVALVCDGPLCSGSSFSRNTWGLGMVSEAQEPFARGHQSLFKALESIGMGVCTPDLPERLVADSMDSIEWLARAGARLRVPEDPSQREYIPCFDNEVRTWRGFLPHASAAPLARTIRKAGVKVYERTRLLTLLVSNSCERQMTGVLTLHKNSKPLLLKAPAVVLCCGGLASLYGSHICPGTTGLGHLAALEVGAHLTNIEFQQLMVGYLEPLHGVVFNEKLWRWVRLTRDEASCADHSPTAGELLRAQEAHSWHGPFTSQRESRLVERYICEAPHGAAYTQIAPEALGPSRPGLVDDYLRWLQDERHVSAGQRLPVALFAHSSNGGVAIDEDGFTGVEGLFAAGEMAGGVHGADRVGGLAGVSAVVFGRRAGRSAAEMTTGNTESQAACEAPVQLRALDPRKVPGHDVLGRMLDDEAMVPRTEAGLNALVDAAQEHVEQASASSRPVRGAIDELDAATLRGVAAWQEARSQAQLTKVLAMAMLARTESRGSHLRADYPDVDVAQERQLYVSMGEDGSLSVSPA